MISTNDEARDDVVAIVEIPAGSDLKVELNDSSGEFERDRRLKEGLRYPVNYGLIPGTLAGDGDPLDVLILARGPLASGTVVTVRPVAVLNMQDTGRDDPKIVAIPSIAMAGTGSTNAFSESLRTRIEEFFQHYKDDPETGSSTVHVSGWNGAEGAKALISRSVDAFAQNDLLTRSLHVHDR